jgi:hypothetical protein
VKGRVAGYRIFEDEGIAQLLLIDFSKITDF